MDRKRLTPRHKDIATQQYIHRLQDSRPNSWSRYMTLKEINDLLQAAREVYEANPNEKSFSLYYKLEKLRENWSEKEDRYRELELLEAHAIFDELPLAQREALTDLLDENMR